MATALSDLAGATRLARALASDLLLYHTEAIEQGLREGRPFMDLEDELLEVRHLFLRRVAASLEPVPLLVRTLGQFFADHANNRGLPADGVAEAIAAQLERDADRLALVITGGGHDLGRIIPLGDGVQVIGRVPEADIQIAADTMSRRHAALIVDGGRVDIEDVESTGGTFVNDEKVRSAPLLVGARIQLGGVHLELIRVARVEAAPADMQAAHAERARVSHHRHVLDALGTALGREGPLAVLLCDLDHLARIQAQHGHAAADELLRAVAQRLGAAAQAHRGASLGRDADGAFLVVLGGSDAAALEHAERLRDAVTGSPVFTSAGPIQPSLAIGVSVRQGASGPGPETLLERARAACTLAKQPGHSGIASA